MHQLQQQHYTCIYTSSDLAQKKGSNRNIKHVLIGGTDSGSKVVSCDARLHFLSVCSFRDDPCFLEGKQMMNGDKIIDAYRSK